MEQRIQIKRGIIQYVLNRQNFYMLPLPKLNQFLRLLEKNQTRDPNLILNNVFIGLMQMYSKFKNNAARHIYQNQKFQNVSQQMKELLLSILSQIHQHQTAQSLTSNRFNRTSMNLPNSYNHLNSLYPSKFMSEGPQNYAKAMQQLKKYQQTISRMSPYFGYNPMVNNPAMFMNYGNQIPPGYFYGQGQLNETDPNKMLYGFNGGLNTHSNAFGNPAFFMNPYQNIYPNGNFTQPQINVGHRQNASNCHNSQKNTYSTNITSEGSKKIQNQVIQQSLRSNSAHNLQKSQQKKHNYQTRRQTASKKSNQTDQRKEKSKDANSSQYLPYGNKKNQKNVATRKINNDKVQVERTFSDKDYLFLPQNMPEFKDARILKHPNQKFLHCACRGFFNYENFFNCSNCHQAFHFKCLCLSDKSVKKSQGLKCSLCLMKMLDPLNKVDRVLCETYIMNISQRPFKKMINFKQVESFIKNKPSKYDIEFRCVRTSNANDMEIGWPDQLQIKINETFIHEFLALQTNSSLKKRRDYPLNMTYHICNRNRQQQAKSLPQSTQITLQVKKLSAQQLSKKRIKNNCTFAFGIYLVQKLNCDQLSAKIISENHIKNPNFLDKLLQSDENQIQIDKITIKLTDPFSWQLIKIPVRGAKCSHAQCFDLKTFISLMYSSKQRTWKCPLCSKDARSFIIDEKQMSIIEQVQKMSQIPHQISIYKGSKIQYKLNEENQDQESLSSKMPKKTKKITKQEKPVKTQNFPQNQNSFGA